MKKESKSVNSYFIYFTYYIEYLSRFQRYTNAFISSILCYIITIKSLLTLHSRGQLCRVKTIEFIFVQIRIQYINISVCEVLQATWHALCLYSTHYPNLFLRDPYGIFFEVAYQSVRLSITFLSPLPQLCRLGNRSRASVTIHILFQKLAKRIKVYRTIITIVKRKQLKFLQHQIREPIIINVIALKVTVMLILMIIMTLVINKLLGSNQSN